MAQTASCSNPQSNKHILEQLLANFQCALCEKFPQNTHICPSCSAMYCFDCIHNSLLTTGPSRRNNCAKCSKTHLNALIKLRCFDNIDQIDVDLESLDLNYTDAPPVSESEPIAELSEMPKLEVKCTQIPAGRVEPVEGLPKAIEGTFTLRNIHRCRLEHVCSERVIDEMGFIWRLRVYPRGFRQVGCSKKMHVWVEMLHGELGCYEAMIELRNVIRLAFIVKKSTAGFIGVNNFIDIGDLPVGNIDLNFRYTVRPASYKAKVQIQQRLLDKHAQDIQLLKGESETFNYRIIGFSGVDWNENYFKKITDKINSQWLFGLHGKHRFAEFQMTLVDGPSGIYDIEITMTHPTAECEKRLHFERVFQINQKSLFNFQTRWDKLAEYGFTHNAGDFLEMKIKIFPLQLDLKYVQEYLGSVSEDESDENDDEEYDYSSSSSSY